MERAPAKAPATAKDNGVLPLPTTASGGIATSVSMARTLTRHGGPQALRPALYQGCLAHRQQKPLLEPAAEKGGISYKDTL